MKTVWFRMLLAESMMYNERVEEHKNLPGLTCIEIVFLNGTMNKKRKERQDGQGKMSECNMSIYWSEEQ